MVTPVPIPNTEVKHLSADNTWLATARESKSLPDLYGSPKDNKLRTFFMSCVQRSWSTLAGVSPARVITKKPVS